MTLLTFSTKLLFCRVCEQREPLVSSICLSFFFCTNIHYLKKTMHYRHVIKRYNSHCCYGYVRVVPRDTSISLPAHHIHITARFCFPRGAFVLLLPCGMYVLLLLRKYHTSYKYYIFLQLKKEL